MLYESGLVLEGGGMRGIFTAGVLDFFLDKDIEFKEVIGVSAGACHGASFLSKQRGRARDVVIDYINDKRYCSVRSLITTGDMFGAKFAYHTIPYELNVFDSETYKNRQTNFFATVTNLETGKAEYLELKDFDEDMDALRASASLPMISRMVEINGKKYLDGGVSDSIPIKKIQSDGFNKNVVVLTQPITYRKESSSAAKYMSLRYKKYPKFIDAMKNRHDMYNNTVDYIEQCEKENTVFVIRPEESLNLGRIEKDKDKLQEGYKKGYMAAQKAYDELMIFLQR